MAGEYDSFFGLDEEEAGWVPETRYKASVGVTGNELLFRNSVGRQEEEAPCAKTKIWQGVKPCRIFVEHRRFELLTPTLPVLCATNCANAPNSGYNTMLFRVCKALFWAGAIMAEIQRRSGLPLLRKSPLAGQLLFPAASVDVLSSDGVMSPSINFSII